MVAKIKSLYGRIILGWQKIYLMYNKIGPFKGLGMKLMKFMGNVPSDA